ncbi:hypothetical protein [Oryza sativa Japonica Group]|uniref:Uncharacterized protein n=2 Tax=Oryza TaxID=4527 RepID=Q5QLJ9_ORYSJ|nr:hypothetical protein DAI22_01g189400 [Oryza sativa Japonica Group]BAD73588.1 hypothetical protein [Oryza sativa Japonica Group]BAD73703.1 hypothetical protein [Oryza sativa Japonica Group]
MAGHKVFLLFLAVLGSLAILSQSESTSDMDGDKSTVDLCSESSGGQYCCFPGNGCYPDRAQCISAAKTGRTPTAPRTLLHLPLPPSHRNRCAITRICQEICHLCLETISRHDQEIATFLAFLFEFIFSLVD